LALLAALRHFGRTLLALAWLIAAISTPAAGSASPAAERNPPLRYTVRFPNPASHYAEVEARIPVGADASEPAGRPADAVELMMAVWTPGSYLVREFANQIDAVTAHDGDGGALAVTKTAKNRWRVAVPLASPGDEIGDEITVSYRLYCHELSVRTNWVDDSFALLNGAATFLTLAGETTPGERVHEVTIELPAGWQTAVSALPAIGDDPRRPGFRAASFDELVDSPIYAGSPRLYPFEVAGIDHLLLNEGEGELWDGARAAADAQRIVEQEAALWGGMPYPRYVFFNLLTESGGGLEHKNSTVLMSSRWATRTRQSYLRWLGLVSHELFHAWNGKRLRPAPLGPFDFEAEVYTHDLWVVEGITSYYDDLVLRRAGLMTHEEYLEALTKAIDTVQTTPGRQVQTLADASFDAWIKHYRRNENSANTTISYYSKGALVSWLLDAALRGGSDGEVSLDTLLRAAYERYSGQRGYAEGEIRALLLELAGPSAPAVAAIYDTGVSTTGELDFEPALAWFGLRFKPASDKGEGKEGDGERGDGAKGDGAKGEEEPGWLGLVAKISEGRLLVSEVRRDTPAFAAGVSPGDEVLALDGYRVLPAEWDKRRANYRPGQAAELLVARRDRLIPLPVTFGRDPGKRWQLVIDEQADEAAVARRRAWLGEDSAPADSSDGPADGQTGGQDNDGAPAAGGDGTGGDGAGGDGAGGDPASRSGNHPGNHDPAD
jgi:predicted metalloprotease with PDZ domain